jgi:type IV pilus assembly protein PilQ
LYAAKENSTDSALVKIVDEDNNGNITIIADNIDLSKVLNAVSQTSKQNIVIAPGVSGTVTARMDNVPWKEALDVILSSHGYKYAVVGSTIVVSEKKGPQDEEDKILDPLVSKVFHLRFLDAADVTDVIKNHITPLGKISIVATHEQQGWEFEAGKKSSDSGNSTGKRQRLTKVDPLERSKTFVIKDTQRAIDTITELIEEIDKLPSLVLIEAKFMETEVGYLEDIGVEWGSGATGAESSDLETISTGNGNNLFGIGAQSISGGSTPINFQPQGSEVAPFDTGLTFAFQQLTKTQFEVLLHAMAEDAQGKVLSTPKILTLDNQEAAIVVGTKFPIIKSDVSGQSATISTTLEYYENIGIQLNVIPQICDDNYIRMLVHPAVSDQTGTTSARTGTGDDTPLTEYPILSTREVETQLLIKSGETVVIGGLIQNLESTSEFRVPYLSRIPVLGFLFRRETTRQRETELVIFITATVHGGYDSKTSPDSEKEAESTDLSDAELMSEKTDTELSEIAE